MLKSKYVANLVSIRVIISGSVRFFLKKSNQTEKKKKKKTPETEPDPAPTGRFRFGSGPVFS